MNQRKSKLDMTTRYKTEARARTKTTQTHAHRQNQ